MPEWLLSLIPLLKGLHIMALVIWCGGLASLPMMLSRHDPAVSQHDYMVIRHGTHLTYTMVVTPAAVIAVIAGTWLIFLRELFVPWLFAKLAMVAMLMAMHAWVGHSIVRIAEEPGNHQPPTPVLAAIGVLMISTIILVQVLGKPDFDWIVFPEWLNRPQGNQLPFEVPRR